MNREQEKDAHFRVEASGSFCSQNRLFLQDPTALQHAAIGKRVLALCGPDLKPHVRGVQARFC